MLFRSYGEDVEYIFYGIVSEGRRCYFNFEINNVFVSDPKLHIKFNENINIENFSIGKLLNLIELAIYDATDSTNTNNKIIHEKIFSPMFDLLHGLKKFEFTFFENELVLTLPFDLLTGDNGLFINNSNKQKVSLIVEFNNVYSINDGTIFVKHYNKLIADVDKLITNYKSYYYTGGEMVNNGTCRSIIRLKNTINKLYFCFYENDTIVRNKCFDICRIQLNGNDYYTDLFIMNKHKNKNLIDGYYCVDFGENLNLNNYNDAQLVLYSVNNMEKNLTLHVFCEVPHMHMYVNNNYIVIQ